MAEGLLRDRLDRLGIETRVHAPWLKQRSKRIPLCASASSVGVTGSLSP